MYNVPDTVTQVSIPLQLTSGSAFNRASSLQLLRTSFTSFVASEAMNGKTCPICLDYLSGTMVYVGQCLHAVHRDCLLLWFTRRSCCPLCRFDYEQ